MRTEIINLNPTEVRQVLDEKDALRKECKRLMDKVESLLKILSERDRNSKIEGGSIK